MKIFLETMGCQMNRLDSELVASALRAAGHEMTDDVHDADVFLVNTCSVRRHAEQKVYTRLGTAAQRKLTKPHLIIGVLGCMAQREGAELRKACPQVDIICSPDRLIELPGLIAAAAAGEKSTALAPSRIPHTLPVPGPGLPFGAVQTPTEPAGEEPAIDADFDALDLSRDPSQTPSPSQAFVRVARGCDKFCTYCVVPYVRGPETCRDPAHVVDEVRKLVDAGRTEVTLLGQTVNSYRFEAHGRTTRFSDLLAMVSPVPGLRRLRFVTSHPLDFGNDVLEAMRDLANICPYIHVPAQSGSDAVLRRMNRRYTRAQYDDLIDRARAIVPGVVLAGDFIVGFPGETEDDHAASADLIRRSGYKNSFIFKYSPRPGTAAARNLEDDVPTETKKRRNNELLAVQNEVGLAHLRAFIGQTVEVLVEGPSPRSQKQPRKAAPGQTQLIGRTSGDHIVVFDGAKSLADQYVNVKIADASSLTLFGTLDQA